MSKSPISLLLPHSGSPPLPGSPCCSISCWLPASILTSSCPPALPPQARTVYEKVNHLTAFTSHHGPLAPTEKTQETACTRTLHPDVPLLLSISHQSTGSFTEGLDSDSPLLLTPCRQFLCSFLVWEALLIPRPHSLGLFPPQMLLATFCSTLGLS